MPTALGTISYLQNSETVRVFFDTGSQMSFLAPSIADSLATPIIYTRISRIQSFTECTETQKLSFVQVTLTLGLKKSTIICALHEGARTAFYAEGLSKCAAFLESESFKLSDSYN